MRILVVGIATLDIVNRVTRYPAEDSEVRALSHSISRGGNATNTAVVLSQLGHQVDWAGVLIEDHNSVLILQDLQAQQIGLDYCHQVSHGSMPTSYITVSEHTGSRSIVHYRACPEFSFAEFQKIPLAQYDWIHFEGRNIPETRQMLYAVKQHHPHLRFSVEIEKVRDNIEQLIPLSDYLMFSQHYAAQTGYDSAPALLKQLPANSTATCSWGSAGVWATFNGEILHQPAYPPAKVVDTLGAGDCLNAGLIHGWGQQHSLPETLYFASRLAGSKCGQQGFSALTLPD